MVVYLPLRFAQQQRPSIKGGAGEESAAAARVAGTDERIEGLSLRRVAYARAAYQYA